MNIHGDSFCDTCGKAATHMVRDEIRQPSEPGDTMDRYTVGPVRSGCAEHPVESRHLVARSPTTIKYRALKP